jgi:hypothetical protein
MKPVFWNFELNKWSANGCQLYFDDSNRVKTVFECNHLTNFAALMDPKQRNDNLKSIFTYIFCGVSVVFLLATFIFLLKQNTGNFSTITEELMRKRNKIMLNLCFCLLIADLLIIFGMDRIDINLRVN